LIVVPLRLLSEEVGFKFNLYDPCVTNRDQNGTQHTLLFHVDDLKSSHSDPKVNGEFNIWLQMKYYGEHGKVVAHCGKIHDYLGMDLDYSKAGKVKIGMILNYVGENMLRDFPEQLKEDTNISKTPAGDDLFNHGQGKKLEEERAEQYHKMVAEGLFLCKKRARSGIVQPTIAVLCTRVKAVNQAGRSWSE
jgi:hypothetical protein